METGLPVTSLSIQADGERLYFGSVDNTIHGYDLKMNAPWMDFVGHQDTITGLRLSPDGTNLLSSAMDHTVRVWDVKPFSAVAGRLVQVLQGAPHGVDKNLLRPCWSTDGTQCASGAADRTVVVWDAKSGKILYKLPGHRGTVNEVDWHPKEPIGKREFIPGEGRGGRGGRGRWKVATHLTSVHVWGTTTQMFTVASCSTDRLIYLGEIEPRS